MQHELDERKMKILQAIIRNYLETGEPVGSRTISKYTDLNLSSATIRNEMADLEELGYILQPHTSAGRIPSDKGYRLYVDSMLEEKDREVADLKELLVEKEDKMDHLLRQVARVLAVNTNYAAMISSPLYHGNKLKFIQLSKVDEHHFKVSANVEISDQFYGWLLGFGRRAKLIWPDDEVEKFKEYLEKVMRTY